MSRFEFFRVARTFLSTNGGATTFQRALFVYQKRSTLARVPLPKSQIFATNKGMKVLLLGASGLLGSEFLNILKAQDEIEYVAPSHRELDVLNFQAVDQLLAHEYFDRILYCVAYTGVDQAEKEQGQCEQLNVDALRNLATHKRPLIHFSSDYIFNAPPGMAIPEDYSRNPLNFYGQSKAKAEEVLEHSGAPYWNIRTSWLFGATRENFVTRMLKIAKTQDQIQVVTDQIGRPTYVKDLAQYVVDYFILQEPPTGHYHLQNGGEPVSRADFADFLLQRIQWTGDLQRVPYAQFSERAVRPKNSVLKNTKMPFEMRDWREATEEFIVDL